MKQLRWLFALMLALTLVAAACGDDGEDEATDTATGTDTGTGTDDTAGEDEEAAPEFEEGTTMARLQEAGKIRVGVKFDQPGFGLKNPTSGEVEGFDVEMAKLIAQAIYGGSLEDQEERIELIESISANREPYIQDGRVDMVIATYTMNEAREQVIDFAGPYYVAKQDIMVKADNDDIQSVDDLNGKKVCTAKGSTSEKNLRAKAPEAEVVLFGTYSECASALEDGRVDAVTTDNTILAGLVKTSGGQFKLVENPFSDEPYGIGIQNNDEEFRKFLNERLQTLFENGEWEAAFERTLGQLLGLKTPEPPELVLEDRDAAGASAQTTTTAA